MNLETALSKLADEMSRNTKLEDALRRATTTTANLNPEQTRALELLRAIEKAARAGGYTYTRGNPRPFAVLNDGRLALDYFIVRDIVDAFDGTV